MPYISPKDREKFPDLVSFENVMTAGELNYVLTKICQLYFETNGSRYQQINDIIGALEGCKLEFYRRLVSKYENQKIEQNGDVYTDAPPGRIGL